MKTRNRIALSATVLAASARNLSDLGFSAAQIAGCRSLVITVNGANNVRYLSTGNTPTATYGHIIKPNDTYEFVQVRDADLIEFIAETADATCTFEMDTYVEV